MKITKREIELNKNKEIIRKMKLSKRYIFKDNYIINVDGTQLFKINRNYSLRKMYLLIYKDKNYKHKTNTYQYIRVTYKNKTQPIHRVIWDMAYGSISKGYVIDHINHNKYDNSLKNLQKITHSENSRKTMIENWRTGVIIKNGFKKQLETI